MLNPTCCDSFAYPVYVLIKKIARNHQLYEAQARDANFCYAIPLKNHTII